MKKIISLLLISLGLTLFSCEGHLCIPSPYLHASRDEYYSHDTNKLVYHTPFESVIGGKIFSHHNEYYKEYFHESESIEDINRIYDTFLGKNNKEGTVFYETFLSYDDILNLVFIDNNQKEQFKAFHNYYAGLAYNFMVVRPRTDMNIDVSSDSYIIIRVINFRKCRHNLNKISELTGLPIRDMYRYQEGGISEGECVFEHNIMFKINTVNIKDIEKKANEVIAPSLIGNVISDYKRKIDGIYIHDIIRNENETKLVFFIIKSIRGEDESPKALSKCVFEFFDYIV